MTDYTHAGVRRLVLALGLVLYGGPWTMVAAQESPRSGDGRATTVLVATVVDAITGVGLPAVEVRVLRAAPGGRIVGDGDATGAETDASGRFVLRAVPPDAIVELARVGYEPLRVPAAEWLDAPTGAGPILGLTPRPVLLNAIAARATAQNRLARGTALTVRTVARDAVEEGAHTSVAEALDGIEGVSMSRVGAWGARPVLRGLAGQRVAVLVNGNRVQPACAFGMDQGLATVDPATVERVEVVAGPGTTLYGSGNIGGVINVVTSRPASDGSGIGGEARFRATSGAPGGTAGATVRLDRGPADVSLAVDGTRHVDYRTPEATVDGSGFGHVTADLTADLTLAPGRELSLQGQLFEGRDIGWPAMPGAEIPRESRRALSLDYGHQLGAGTLDALAARGYIQRLDHEMIVTMRMDGDMPMTSVTTQRSHSTVAGARFQTRLVPHPAVHIDAGVETTGWWAEATRATERTTGDMPPSELSLHTWPGVALVETGAFAQGQLRLPGGVVASGGLRLDHVARSADGWPSTDEWVRSGNVGLSAGLPLGFGLRASVGYGYRAPDATELFGLALRPDGFIYRGNPELGTETNRNLEAGVTFDAGTVSASVTAFRNDLDGLISPAASPGDSVGGHPVRTYANLAEARLTGWSASGGWQPADRLRLRGHASYTRGEDGSGEPLPAMPPLEAGLAVRYLVGAGTAPWVEVETRGASTQTRNAESLGEPETPAYLLLDLRSGARLMGADLVLGVDNVLDTAHRGHLDPVRLLRPGRSVYLSARVGF